MAWNLGSGEEGHAESDSEGRYEIKGLPPGSFHVGIVPRESLKDWTAEFRAAEPIKAGDHLDGQDLTLIKGGEITGRVTGAADGRGISGLRVGVGELLAPYWAQAGTTDAAGRYHLRAPPGERTVWLEQGQMPEGYDELALDKMAVPIRVVAGGSVSANFSLPADGPADYISGQILDREGKPVERAHILAIADTEIYGGTLETWSDTKGEFRIKIQAHNERAQTMKVLASHPQLGVSAEPVEISRGGKATIALHPGGFASADFRIIDTAGHSISHAKVEMWGDLGKRYFVDRRYVHTGSDGRYHLDRLWPGIKYVLLPEAKGLGATDTQSFVAAPAENRLLPEVVLEPANQVISGRLADARGRPVAKFDISAYSLFLRSHAKTDSRGRFRLENLTSGWFWLEIPCEYQTLPVMRAKGGSTGVVVEKPARVDDVVASEAMKMLATRLVGQRAPLPVVDPLDWVGPPLPQDLATSFKGRVVVLNFWELSSEDCLKEMPKIEAFYQANKANGLLVLGLGEPDYPAAEVREVLARQRLEVSYPLARDARGHLGKTATVYGVGEFPTYAVIDRQGLLIYLGHEWGEAKTRTEVLLAHPD
jgi:thiol-disulfide isomerase/thioredoxin